MISLAARGGISLDDIIDQLMSTGACPSYRARTVTKQDTSQGSCCPMAVGYALKEMQNEVLEYIIEKPSTNIIPPEIYPVDAQQCSLDLSEFQKKLSGAPLVVFETCPECGEAMVRASGCVQCPSCGYSKCD